MKRRSIVVAVCRGYAVSVLDLQDLPLAYSMGNPRLGPPPPPPPPPPASTLSLVLCISGIEDGNTPGAHAHQFAATWAALTPVMGR
jgi:hypothetical protein